MRFLPSTIPCLLTCIGLAGTVRAAVAQSCEGGQLTLAASASLSLPSTLGVQGFEASRDGRLVLWSPSGELLLVDASRRLTTYQLPDTVSPVGVARSIDGGFRLIDTRTGREMLADNDKVVAVSGDLRRPGDVIERAMPWGDGWILGITNLQARRFVVRHVRAGSSVTLFESATADSVQKVLRYNLTAAGNRLLLSLGSAPFTVLRIDPATGGTEALPIPLSAADAPRIPADSLIMWRSVSVVPIDCATLVTLSDLTSDRRVLVRYGATDRIEKYTLLNAPLGLMTRIPGTRTVLGARRAGELELVWYDWRWVREPSAAGQ
jgi:hypothetical protein